MIKRRRVSDHQDFDDGVTDDIRLAWQDDGSHARVQPSGRGAPCAVTIVGLRRVPIPEDMPFRELPRGAARSPCHSRARDILRPRGFREPRHQERGVP